jgi:hypothetical protein
VSLKLRGDHIMVIPLQFYHKRKTKRTVKDEKMGMQGLFAEEKRSRPAHFSRRIDNWLAECVSPTVTAFSAID